MQSNRHLFSFKGHKIIIIANELAVEAYRNLSMELIAMPWYLVIFNSVTLIKISE